MADPNLRAYPLQHGAPSTGPKGSQGLEMANFAMGDGFNRAETAEERRQREFTQAKYGRVLALTKRNYRTLIWFVSACMGAIAIAVILWALHNEGLF